MKNFSISKKERTYGEATHLYGRIWGTVSVFMMMLYPIVAGIMFKAWPTWGQVGAGIMGIIIFYIAGIMEFISYTPLLGPTSIYLGFITGNLSTLKVPCALSCLEAEKEKVSSEKGEIIATVSTAVSSITTVLIILVGVLLLMVTGLDKLLEKPVAQAASNYVVPALFGGLAVAFVGSAWKIALPPIIVMTALCMAVPAIASAASFLVPFVAALTVLWARYLYKKGLLEKKPAGEAADTAAGQTGEEGAEGSEAEDALPAGTAGEAIPEEKAEEDGPEAPAEVPREAPDESEE